MNQEPDPLVASDGCDYPFHYFPDLLGDVTSVETLICLDQDGPELFVCTSSNGRSYLGFSVSKTSEEEVVLYVPITCTGRKRLEFRGSLLEQFQFPSQGPGVAVLTISAPNAPSIEPDGVVTHAVWKHPTQIPAKWVPRPVNSSLQETWKSQETQSVDTWRQRWRSSHLLTSLIG